MEFFIAEGNCCKDTTMRPRPSQAGSSVTIRWDRSSVRAQTDKRSRQSRGFIKTVPKTNIAHKAKKVKKVAHRAARGRGNGWNMTNLLYEPTWKLSTSIFERTEEAHYIDVHNILFHKSGFDKSYRRQCIEFEEKMRKSARRLTWRKIEGKLVQQAGEEEPEKKGNLKVKKKANDIAANLGFLYNQVRKILGESSCEGTMKEVMAMGSALLAIKDTRSYMGSASVLYLYFERYLSTDDMVALWKYLYGDADAGKKPWFAQSGVEEKEANAEETSDTSDDPDWIKFVRDAFVNWQLVSQNPLFGHLSKLLGVLVTIGLCDAANLTFSIKSMKLIQPDLTVVHGTAFDAIDAFLGTVKYFVETGAACWEAGSVMPFLFDDQKAIELEEDYHKLVRWEELLVPGNLFKVLGITDQEFDNELERVTSDYKAILPVLNGFAQRMAKTRIRELVLMKHNYVTRKIAQGIRKAPFAIELFGSSAQGKTFFGDQLVTALLSSAGLPTDANYRATYNPSEEFMSTWRTDKVVMTIDDMANDKSQFVGKAPTRVIIDICNNTPFIANMAELEKKGKVFVEPSILLVTTNVKHLDSKTYSNNPFSVQRRMNIVITVVLKDEFASKDPDGNITGVDHMKLSKYQEEIKGDFPFDDIWALTLEEAVRPKEDDHLAHYRVVEHGGKRMENLSIAEVVEYLTPCFVAHLEREEMKVLTSKNMARKLTKCGIDGCRVIRQCCSKHKHLHALVETNPKVVEKKQLSQEVLQARKTPQPEVDGKEMELCLENSDETQTRIPPTGKKIEGGKSKIRKVVREKLCKETSDDDRPEKLQKSADAPLQKGIGFTDEEGLPVSMDPHAGLEYGDLLYDSIERAAKSIVNTVTPDFLNFTDTTEKCTSTALLFGANCLARHWDWLKIIPTNWLDNKNFKYYSGLIDRHKIARSVFWMSGVMWILIGIAMYVAYPRTTRKQMSFLTCAAVGAGLTTHSFITKIALRRYDMELRSRNLLPDALQEKRDAVMPVILRSSLVVFGFYTIYALYQVRARKEAEKSEPHGNLEPKSEEDVEKRDSEVNPYCQVMVTPLEVPKAARTTTSKQLLGLVEKNLVYASVEGEGNTLSANCLFLRTGVAVLPQHYFEKEVFEVVFRKKNPDVCGCSFKCKVSKKQAYFVPDSDLAVLYVSTGGDFKDITSYFPLSAPDKIDFTLKYRRKDGTMEEASGLTKWGLTGHKKKTFQGIRYASLTMNTRLGLCGATLVANVKPLIIGFHVGGAEGTPQGCASTLFTKNVEAALKHLSAQSGVLLTGSSGEFNPHMLGVNVVTGETLSKKSAVGYMPEESVIRWHGNTLGKSTFKSRARVTLISEAVMDEMNSPNIYMGPEEKPAWKAWQECLASMATPGCCCDPNLLSKAVEDYQSALLPIFRMNLWCSARPLSDAENWNGIPGKKFVDRIKTDTAIGFPLVGPKMDYLVEVQPVEPYTKMVEPTELIQNEIARLLNAYARGERAYPIAKGCKKDEILAKVKCRIFFSNPIAFTFLIRKYFLPIVRVLQCNPTVSETAVGVNCHGDEWEQLYSHLMTFGQDRIIGGDYGKYDQKIPSQMLLAALRCCVDFAKQCNYSEDDLRIMETMCGDLVYAIIAYDGELIGLTSGSHISGNSLTVVLNSIVGSLNMRSYFFSQIAESRWNNFAFRDYVKLITYGDDNIGTVSPKIDSFTIGGFSKWLAEHGQIYTMPDKESELRDFLPPEEFEFLKRVSVYHEKLGVHVGALQEKSIFKNLHYYLREKNPALSEKQACAQNLDNACREWFNHGEDVYNTRTAQLKKVAERCGLMYLCKELDTSYNDRVERWHSIYTFEIQCGFECQQEDDGRIQKTRPVVPMGCQDVVEQDIGSQITDVEEKTQPQQTAGPSTITHKRVTRIDGRNWISTCQNHPPCLIRKRGYDQKRITNNKIQENKKIKTSLDNVDGRYHDILLVTRNDKSDEKHGVDGISTFAFDGYTVVDSVGTVKRVKKFTATQFVKKLFSHSANQFETHSGNEPTPVETGVAFQNVTFEDTPQMTQSWKEPFSDETRKGQDATDASLGQFLSRPVRIKTFKWDTGTNLNEEFNPWTEFLTNPRVINRINNFNLMRCNLRLRILINGNAFQYGRLICSYLPLSDWDSRSLTTGLTDNNSFLMQASQRPHLYLDPCKSQGGEMLLPFFFHKNYLNIPDGNWTQMGTLSIGSFAPLKHANGADDKCTISVFAWAEDVTMSIPTFTQASGLVPQSGVEVDEGNEKGTISGPASALANAAGRLSMIPEIGPYATATSKVAEGVAGMARIFGMSRPPLTEEPHAMRPTSIGSLAVTTTPTQLEKLSVDDKQELSIDPRIAGINEPDSLSLLNIAQKESYLTSFDWSTSAVPDQLLWNCAVNPLLGCSAVGDTDAACLTALAAASFPFTYWNGCIKFRFQLVTSAFHKGRIKIVYDPYILGTNSSPLPPTFDEFNVTYTEVVDISEKNDFSVTINNSQEISLLRTNPSGFINVPDRNYSDSPITSFRVGSNGALGVYVVNDLTTPNSTVNNDIKVNVFVSAGDQYELYVPNDNLQDVVFFPQSGVEMNETQTSSPVGDTNEEEQNQVSVLGVCKTIDDKVPLVYTGESIKSFRPLLKRYNFHTTLTQVTNGADGGQRCSYGVRNMFPYFRGKDVTTVDTITDPVGGYNLCNTLMFHWVISCFSGFRGGTRWKLAPFGSYADLDAFVSRTTDRLVAYEDVNFDLGDQNVTLANVRNNTTDDDTGWKGIFSNSTAGACYSLNTVNPVMEFEVPFYSQWRFVPGKRTNFASAAENWTDGWQYSIKSRRASNGLPVNIASFFSVAEDFQCYFWTGMPIVYLSEPVTV